MNTFKIKATVITPISIGNGTQYSPYRDYFISENKVHYIEERKLGDLLAKRESLMDEYIEGVANMEGNRSRFDIKNFIRDSLSINPKEVVKKSLDFNGNALAKLPINSFIKMPNGQPYIPGSSIKGALKTALVYTDLEKTNMGEKWKSGFFQQLERIDFNRRVNERFLQRKLKDQLSELEVLLKKKAEIKNNVGVIERLIL